MKRYISLLLLLLYRVSFSEWDYNKERFSKIKEGDIVEFTLDKYYEDFEGYLDYDCNLKVAF